MYNRKNLGKISKTLRSNQTPWEAKLWNYLRGNRLAGFKFKRQVPIGQFVVDFCCHEKRLIIELDGGHHNKGAESQADKLRQRYLESVGYKVLRFWNNDIDENMEGIYQVIKEALGL